MTVLDIDRMRLLEEIQLALDEGILPEEIIEVVSAVKTAVVSARTVLDQRPETDMEHISRDMRDGVFPARSERQMVPQRADALDKGAAGEPVAWRWRIGDHTPWVVCDRPPPKSANLLVRPLYAHPSPSPAADADRVLSVTDDEISVLLEVLAYAGDEVANATAASSLFIKAEAVAALKSTAAKEGAHP